MSQQLLSRTVLERVVRDEGLAADHGMDEAVAQLRLRILPVTVPDSIAPSESAPRLDMFVVSYLDRTPHDAQRVANRLADVFVDETSRTRELRAEDTSEFLTGQLKAAERRLGELEDRLRDAKRANMGRLPEQTTRQPPDAQRPPPAAGRDGHGAEERTGPAVDDRAAARRHAAGPDGLPLVARARPARDRAGSRAAARAPAGRRARMVYTDKHPEIARLEEELKQARADAAAERSRPPADRLEVLQNDPAYRQLLADQEMARLRVRDLQRAEAQSRRDIQAYQARVESAPLVEQQMASLQREYDLQKGPVHGPRLPATGGRHGPGPGTPPGRRALQGVHAAPRGPRSPTSPTRCGCS